MTFAETANRIFARAVADYHLRDNVDTAMQNPFRLGSIENELYTKAWIDTVQWHLEDIIRDPKIDPVQALTIKRRIDNSNQDRTDLVERIDAYFYNLYSRIKPGEGAKLNTESPAWAIDRLAILNVKIYHMRIEAARTDTSEAQQAKCRSKLAVLECQLADLTLAIDELLDDYEQGRRVMKVYRQMKMYNDPELNPVLYAKH